jgi:hypothetical protein
MGHIWGAFNQVLSLRKKKLEKVRYRKVGGRTEIGYIRPSLTIASYRDQNLYMYLCLCERERESAALPAVVGSCVTG